MSHKQHEIDPQFGILFLAGEYVSAGVYRNLRTGRELHLAEDGFLPPSFDGNVAVYALAPRTWATRMQPLSRGTGAALSREGAALPQP